MSSLLIKSQFFNISAYTKNITIFEDITPHIVFNERLQMIIIIAAVTFLSMDNGQTISETFLLVSFSQDDTSPFRLIS
jgi:hypothetical protein